MGRKKEGCANRTDTKTDRRNNMKMKRSMKPNIRKWTDMENKKKMMYVEM